jgi:hypothetical protein
VGLLIKMPGVRLIGYHMFFILYARTAPLL